MFGFDAYCSSSYDYESIKLIFLPESNVPVFFMWVYGEFSSMIIANCFPFF